MDKKQLKKIPQFDNEDHFAAPSRIDARGTQGVANKRDVPYQSLLKVFLAERIDQEMRSA